MITSGPFRNREADQKLAESLETIGICRTICDGQRGYGITFANGVKVFRFRLGDAIRDVVRGLGHGEDREVLIIGEPEEGNCW